MPCWSFVQHALAHAEQVAGMLPVHRRDKFPPVDILDRHHRDFEIGQQNVAGLRWDPRAAHGMDGAAHDEVDLDLDLHLSAADEQLGFAGIGGGDACCEARRSSLSAACRTASPMR